MTNKNKKDFFSELEKELPFSPYGERFKEELTEHLEDSTEDYIKKGAGLENATDEALTNLGKSEILSQTYTKYLRPDLLLRSYFEATLIGTISATLTTGYLFFSISGPPDDYYGNGLIETLFFWTLKRVIPFLLFALFYFSSIKNIVQNTVSALRISKIFIIALIPLIVLGIWFVSITNNNDLLLEIIKVLSVNFTAYAFAIYLLLRSPKKWPLISHKAWHYIYSAISILVILSIVVGSIILQFYLKMPYQYQYPYMGEPIFLRPLVVLELFIKTILGVDFFLQPNISEVWFYGVIFTTIGALCMVDIFAHLYKSKRNSIAKFPWFKLVLLTFIASVMITNPEASYKTEISWHREAVNLTRVIEKRQTGPFHNLFLRWFKKGNALTTVANTRLIENGFAIDRFYSENHFEEKKFFEQDSYRTFAIKNIQSINNFIITDKLAEGVSFSLESLTSLSPTLPQGFTCTKYTGEQQCIKLTYKDIPIFSDNPPGNTLISIKVDPQNKWALIQFPDSVYLVSLK